MAVRRYRVISAFLTFAPGQVIELDDEEVPSLCDKLEAVDQQGYIILGIAKLQRGGGASVSEFVGLDDGNWRPILAALRQGLDPPEEGLARLLRTSYPPPTAVTEYLASLLAGDRKRPRRRPQKLPPSFRESMTEAIAIRRLRDRLDQVRRQDRRQDLDRRSRADLRETLIMEFAHQHGLTPSYVEKELRKYRARPSS